MGLCSSVAQTQALVWIVVITLHRDDAGTISHTSDSCLTECPKVSEIVLVRCDCCHYLRILTTEREDYKPESFGILGERYHFISHDRVALFQETIMKPESILFAAIKKTTPAERAAYLDGACGTDLKLRKEIEVLLQAHERSGEFMEKPAIESTAAFDPRNTTSFTHQNLEQIGPYKLREKLGEGGMGTVYVADQKEPVQRRVAIKLIKTGSDSKSLLARFEQERQALALMDHPNIAKVFDAGVFELSLLCHGTHQRRSYHQVLR